MQHFQTAHARFAQLGGQPGVRTTPQASGQPNKGCGHPNLGKKRGADTPPKGPDKRPREAREGCGHPREGCGPPHPRVRTHRIDIRTQGPRAQHTSWLHLTLEEGWRVCRTLTPSATRRGWGARKHGTLPKDMTEGPEGCPMKLRNADSCTTPTPTPNVIFGKNKFSFCKNIFSNEKNKNTFL
jgi:hypothetical protein